MRKWGSPCRPRWTLRLTTSPTWHPVSSCARAAKSLLGLVFVGGGGFAGGVAVFPAVVLVFRRVARVFLAGVVAVAVAVAVVSAVVGTVTGDRICGNVSNRLCFQVISLIVVVLVLEVPDFRLVAMFACQAMITYFCPCIRILVRSCC